MAQVPAGRGAGFAGCRPCPLCVLSPRCSGTPLLRGRFLGCPSCRCVAGVQPGTVPPRVYGSQQELFGARSRPPSTRCCPEGGLAPARCRLNPRGPPGGTGPGPSPGGAVAAAGPERSRPRASSAGRSGAEAVGRRRGSGAGHTGPLSGPPARTQPGTASRIIFHFLLLFYLFIFVPLRPVPGGPRRDGAAGDARGRRSPAARPGPRRVPPASPCPRAAPGPRGTPRPLRGCPSLSLSAPRGAGGARRGPGHGGVWGDGGGRRPGAVHGTGTLPSTPLPSIPPFYHFLIFFFLLGITRTVTFQLLNFYFYFLRGVLKHFDSRTAGSAGPSSSGAML